MKEESKKKVRRVGRFNDETRRFGLLSKKNCKNLSRQFNLGPVE